MRGALGVRELTEGSWSDIGGCVVKSCGGAAHEKLQALHVYLFVHLSRVMPRRQQIVYEPISFATWQMMPRGPITTNKGGM
jgi:hypothetical protein